MLVRPPTSHMHAGSCQSGADLATCAKELFATCEEFNGGDPDTANTGVLQEDGTIDLVNDCGGHANPLHYHTDMFCHYNSNDSTPHSAIVGVMNDGRGMYRKWEGIYTLNLYFFK